MHAGACGIDKAINFNKTWMNLPPSPTPSRNCTFTSTTCKPLATTFNESRASTSIVSPFIWLSIGLSSSVDKAFFRQGKGIPVGDATSSLSVEGGVSLGSGGWARTHLLGSVVCGHCLSILITNLIRRQLGLLALARFSVATIVDIGSLLHPSNLFARPLTVPISSLWTHIMPNGSTFSVRLYPHSIASRSVTAFTVHVPHVIHASIRANSDVAVHPPSPSVFAMYVDIHVAVATANVFSVAVQSASHLQHHCTRCRHRLLFAFTARPRSLSFGAAAHQSHTSSCNLPPTRAVALNLPDKHSIIHW